jgi:hypothetical protein
MAGIKKNGIKPYNNGTADTAKCRLASPKTRVDNHPTEVGPKPKPVMLITM